MKRTTVSLCMIARDEAELVIASANMHLFDAETEEAIR